MEISGQVIDCRDSTPPGLADVPRRLLFVVEREDGSVAEITYTAFPPSPFGDSQAAKIRLNLHEGKIMVGHHMNARDSFDAEANRLTVAGEGDFMETFASKPD